MKLHLNTNVRLFETLGVLFKIYILAKNVVGSCDEELDMHVTDTKGILATPGFELGTYFNETDCFWIINTLPELRIEVSSGFESK